MLSGLFFYNSSFNTDHLSTSLPSVHAALAGLVDGRQISALHVTGSVNFAYKLCAVFPFVKIAFIFAPEMIGERSFGVTFFIDESELPTISHEAITSQRAIPCESNKDFFSSTVSGSGLSVTDAITRQNLF